MNETQRALLNDMYGYNRAADEGEQEGSEIGTIVENTLITLDQTILYLTKAITEDCQTFLVSLDHLYAHCQGKNQQEAMTLIKALKRLNDVCWNNEIRLERIAFVDEQPSAIGYYNKPILDHLFDRLGPVDSIVPAEFHEEMKKYVTAAITRINSAHPNLAILPPDTRLPTEPNLAWRSVVGLPDNQSPQVVRPRHHRGSYAQWRGRPVSHHEQRVAELPIIHDALEPANTHYSSSITALSSFSEVYRNASNDLLYACLNLDIPARGNHPDSIEFRLVRQSQQDREVLIVSPRTPGATISLLGEYCQHADQSDQAQLANAAVSFLRHLTDWETLAPHQRYLEIEPKFLIVERDATGEIALNRIGFEKSPEFFSRDATFTMCSDNRFGPIFSAPERKLSQYSSSSSAFGFGASLFAACFTEEEFLSGLSRHLRHDAKKAHIFELLINPFLPSATMEEMIREKCARGQLHENLANIMRATLVSDPELRRQNIAEFLARPSQQPRPGFRA